MICTCSSFTLSATRTVRMQTVLDMIFSLQLFGVSPAMRTKASLFRSTLTLISKPSGNNSSIRFRHLFATSQAYTLPGKCFQRPPPARHLFSISRAPPTRIWKGHRYRSVDTCFLDSTDSNSKWRMAQRERTATSHLYLKPRL